MLQCLKHAHKLINKVEICIDLHGTSLTTEILQDKVQLPPCLEGVDEVHNKRMLYFLQDVPLSFGVRCVLGVTHNHGLGTGQIFKKRNSPKVRV